VVLIVKPADSNLRYMLHLIMSTKWQPIDNKDRYVSHKRSLDTSDSAPSDNTSCDGAVIMYGCGILIIVCHMICNHYYPHITCKLLDDVVEETCVSRLTLSFMLSDQLYGFEVISGDVMSE
jgi:hypothetical protein